MNFWIDVTNTCKSAINTGVPRTVRGIYQILQQYGQVTPLRWDHPSQSYCRLTPTEQRALDGDLSAHPSKFWRPLVRIFNKIDLLSKMEKDDFFVQVEIFQDRRNEWIHQHVSQFKSIAVFHDAIAWTHPELTAPQRRPRFDDYMNSLHAFTHVISISEASGEALRHHWKENHLDASKKITIIPWPTEFPDMAPKSNSSSSLKEILTISTLEQRKNHLRLLHACEKLWSKGLSFKLRVLGKKCPFWGDRVVQEIKRLQDQGRLISWENQVSDEELHAAYQSSYFTIYPSIVEGFGLPILESLWHHRPCICSYTGAIAETAKAGGCLTVDVHSQDAMAEAMESLLTQDALYHQLQSQTESMSFMSWEDYGKKFREVLLS
ncbi:MAG: glycosyltransferase [Verrucomicrobiota bacterium]